MPGTGHIYRLRQGAKGARFKWHDEQHKIPDLSMGQGYASGKPHIVTVDAKSFG